MWYNIIKLGYYRDVKKGVARSNLFIIMHIVRVIEIVTSKPIC